MSPLRCLLIDDEPLARRGLRLRLTQLLQAEPELGPLEVIGEASSGREGLALIEADAPDLVFLDIQMPGLDGFQMLAALPMSQWPLVIFVTAYDQYALDAFRVHAVDYLLKPVDTEPLRAALIRARKLLPNRIDAEADNNAALMNLVGAERGLSLAETQEDRLTLKDGNSLIRIPIQEIRWIDAAGDYVVVHTTNGNHIARASLRELEDRLPTDRFARIHRSTIVAISAVQRLRPHQNGEYFIDLDGGKELKLSRGYRAQIERFV